MVLYKACSDALLKSDSHAYVVCRFEDRSRPDTFLKDVYSKRIPADGFPEYASRIWVCMFRYGSISVVYPCQPSCASG